ncbi:MAG: hypothetical protein DRP37_02460 [Thermodesulfobacteriota bacterium]|nr:MAG: hypothetical protein DRP37_02460 [Thermodesulfobacteriota bacterium]
MGKYFSKLINVKLISFLGRDWYERGNFQTNHHNGSYSRHFTLKGIGDVKVKTPRACNGKFKTQVIPKSNRYEDKIREDLSFMFLTGIRK